jgi:hypothetical protein
VFSDGWTDGVDADVATGVADGTDVTSPQPTAMRRTPAIDALRDLVISIHLQATTHS